MAAPIATYQWLQRDAHGVLQWFVVEEESYRGIEREEMINASRTDGATEELPHSASFTGARAWRSVATAIRAWQYVATAVQDQRFVTMAWRGSGSDFYQDHGRVARARNLETVCVVTVMKIKFASLSHSFWSAWLCLFIFFLYIAGLGYAGSTFLNPLPDLYCLGYSFFQTE